MQRSGERQTRYAWRDLKLAFAAAAVLCGSAALAQQRAGETIEVSIVNVDVNVTDKKGNPITGLGASDFEIREDGRVQPISNFSEYGSASASAPSAPVVTSGAAVPAPASVTPPSPRTVVLFIEPVTLPAADAKKLVDSMRAFVRQTVRPGDRAMIATWDTALKVRQPLTDDLPLLDRALAAIEKDFAKRDANTATDVRGQQTRLTVADDAFSAAVGATGSASAWVKMDAMSAATQEYAQIQGKMFAIRALMEGISGFDGKKVMLLSAKLGSLAGAEFFDGTVPKANRVELDTKYLRASLISTANAKGITIYPVFSEGMAWATTYDASVARTSSGTLKTRDQDILMNETYSLQEIATETGGVLSSGSTDIAAVLPRIGAQLDAYYSLGYRAQPTGKDQARRIVVTTRNRDYVVRSRKQVLEVSDAGRMKDRVLANLFQPMAGSGIPFTVAVNPTEASGKDLWTTTLKIQIPIGSLLTLNDPSGQSGAFSVFVATGSDSGAVSDVEQRTQSFTIAEADMERAKKSHYTYEFVLQLNRIIDHASVGVMDETSKEYGLRRVDIPKK